jgi:GNAT superfamily N-acetyltransferase
MHDGVQVNIRELSTGEGPAAVEVINRAAEWYAEFLGPLDEPEMDLAEWLVEAGRMTWFGAFEAGELVGVMGLEYVADVALLRHAYVLPDRQRRGVGEGLRQHLEAEVTGVDLIVVGTYRANYKARRALEKAGYVASSDPEGVLRRYYGIGEHRLRTSLTYEKRIEVPG